MTPQGRYWKAIRAIAKATNTTPAIARSTYRVLRTRYDKPVTASDIKRHPIITAKAGRTADYQRRAAKARATIRSRMVAQTKTQRTRAIAKQGRAFQPSADQQGAYDNAPFAVTKPVRDLDAYDDLMDW